MMVHILLDCGKSARSIFKRVEIVVHMSLWSVKGSRLRTVTVSLISGLRNCRQVSFTLAGI